MKKGVNKPAQRRTVSINEIPGGENTNSSSLKSRHDRRGAQSIKRNSPTPRRHYPIKSKDGKLLLEDYSFCDLPQIQDLNLIQIKEIINDSSTLPALVKNLLKAASQDIDEFNARIKSKGK